ncbi:MAG: phenylacetate--CoA ligase [Chloroflexi bacterium]|nr:phenylacetate--CoA ligase [Chloroflexota bacterium]MDA8188634.1 phenylacetate--CoA ligase [Dehalococcoidales bacterium]
MSNPNLIWNKEFETMPREELRKLQLQRLKQTVERAYHKVHFYKAAFDEKGVKPEDIESLDDLNKLPFTMKKDLRDNYPFGMLSEPLENIVRIHASSGTTGKPIIGAYNSNDMNAWGEAMARVYTACGATSKDVVQNAYGYGLFTGGLGFHLGAERIGATVIPAAAGMSQRQLMLMEDLGTTVLTCTPSYALSLAETMAEMGISRDRLKVKCGIFGAEPWSEGMRAQIEERWQIDAYNIFGLTELGGPGVACECAYKSEMHIWEDHFLPEIIDPNTGEQLGYGQIGELVLTGLTKEALPIIRYRTRDLTVLNAEPCACGRTHVRMDRIKGRTDDMLIIRGVNVFPSQIETAILRVPDLEPQYVIIVDREKSVLDNLEVRVEATESLWSGGEAAREAAARQVNKEFQQIVGMTASVKIVEPKSIQRSEGKAQRVIDKRSL